MITFVLFGLFALTLLGIARYHDRVMQIALAGLACVLVARLALTDLDLGAHVAHEWRSLVNLAGLLLGFAGLAAHFERSHLPEKLTEVLPAGRKGAFALLASVAVLSAVLDNIAAAMIGGTAAATLFQRRVHVGYLAALVAASNAGGAGSAIGDTTTTMLWIDGVSPLWLAKAAVGAGIALLFFGTCASRQQHALQPLTRLPHRAMPIDLARVGIVALIIAGAVVCNLLLDFPAVGVWAALLLGGLVRRPDWRAIAGAGKGTVFLSSLVLTASLMPVEALPTPSVASTFGLGVISATFDNIPLTKLALAQGGYDWGLLAYAVGYGGSMLWFGSSAGVALAALYPEAKSAKRWLIDGWHVAVGYGLGFGAMLALFGWQVHDLVRSPTAH